MKNCTHALTVTEIITNAIRRAHVNGADGIRSVVMIMMITGIIIIVEILLLVMILVVILIHCWRWTTKVPTTAPFDDRVEASPVPTLLFFNHNHESTTTTEEDKQFFTYVRYVNQFQLTILSLSHDSCVQLRAFWFSFFD